VQTAKEWHAGTGGEFVPLSEEERNNCCCCGQAKLQAAKRWSWAGRSPSGDPGGGLSMCQLCGLAVLSTGTAIGDEGRRFIIARVLVLYEEDLISLCVLQP